MMCFLLLHDKNILFLVQNSSIRIKKKFYGHEKNITDSIYIDFRDLSKVILYSNMAMAFNRI